MRTTIVTAAIMLLASIPSAVHAESWPGFEGLFHQNSSKVDLNASGANAEVKWDSRFTPQWQYSGRSTYKAGSLKGDFGARNLTFNNGYLGLGGLSTDSTYSQGDDTKCQALVLNADDGSVETCFYTNQWMGSTHDYADSMDCEPGKMVGSWDPDTGIFFLSAGGDHPSRRAYFPLDNADTYNPGSGTAVRGIGAWEDFNTSYPGFVSSRGTVDQGAGAVPATRANEDGFDGAQGQADDECSTGTSGASTHTSNLTSFCDVQPGSEYLLFTNGTAHNKTCGISMTNKNTGMHASETSQVNEVWEFWLTSIGPTGIFKRWGGQLTQGSRVYYMGPWQIRNFTNGNSVTDNGDGTVTIPGSFGLFSLNPWLSGRQVKIFGTTNYNGTYTLQPGSGATQLVITKAYVAETFDGTEYVLSRDNERGGYEGLRLTCLDFVDQDNYANDGYTGPGAAETAHRDSVIYDYQLASEPASTFPNSANSWGEYDTAAQNKCVMIQNNGQWVAWKPNLEENVHLVRASATEDPATNSWNLGVGADLGAQDFEGDFAYADTGTGYVVYYFKSTNGDVSSPFDGSDDRHKDKFWTVVVFDVATKSVKWSYNLKSHPYGGSASGDFTSIPTDISTANIEFSKMTVAGKYALVSWIDTSDTNCKLTVVPIDVTAASAPASAPTPFVYELASPAVASATYPMTRVSDTAVVNGVLYALITEDDICGGRVDAWTANIYDVNGLYEAQRVVAIDTAGRSEIGMDFSVSPSSGAGKIVALCDASSVTTTDPGGISSYEWDFSYDHLTFNSESTGEVAPHTFSTSGTHTVALRATDSTGNSEIRFTTVEVSASSSGSITYEDGDGIEDTYAQKSSPTWRPATSTEFQIHGAGLANESCAILKFDVASIPGGSTIDSANLQIYLFNRSGSGTFSIGSFPSDALTVSGACWDYRDISNNAWSATTPIASATAFDTLAQPGSTGWVAFDVASAIQDWVDGTETNNGLGIWASATLDDRFYSTENSTDISLSPKITINYSGGAAAEAVHAVHPGSAAAESYAPSSPVTVNWGTEGPIETVDLYYSTTADTGPWTSIASGQTNDGAYSWDASALAGSATVWVRVTKAGDTGTAAVSANSFEIEADTSYTVSGSVTITGDSTATNGVTIALKNGPLTVDSQVLDGTGNYSLDAPDGSYSYELTGPGYSYAVTTPNPNSVTVSGGAVVQNVQATATSDSPAWSWDGEEWASPDPYLSLIDSTVKANLRAIYTAGVSSGRIAGRMGQIGDSITNSQAYFTGTLGGGTSTNETGHDFTSVMGWISPAISEYGHSYPVAPNWNSWYRNGYADPYGSVDDWHKGGSVWCNQSGWKVSDAVAAGHPANVITYMNPSWAVIMYGTNDIDTWGSGTLVADSNTWKTSYKSFVQGFIDDDVIPVLSTIPPEHAYAPDGGTGDERYTIANQRIIEIADELDIPYIDYYGWITDKQPGNAWDGAYQSENRLISTDGTHPSNTTSNFSETALTWNGGYRARTMLTLAMAEKIEAVIFDDGGADSDTLRVSTVSLVDGAFGGYYGPLQLRAWGGTEPYSWSEVGSNLPSGLTITAAGQISGTIAEAGTFTITVQVTDDNTDTDTQSLVLEVTGGPATYTVGVAGDYPTITLALAACSGGETIEIIDAVHTEQGVTVDKSVTIQGLGADNTIVQAHAVRGSATDRVFSVTAADTILADMTIKHGNTSGDGGGVNTTANLTISGCEIVDNNSTSGSGGGGGIAVNGGFLTVLDSTIAGNIAAYRAGGIMFWDTTGGTLENCTIADNTGNRSGSSAVGGGVYVYDGSAGNITVDIYNCTISGNSAPNGGGGGLNNWNQTVNLFNTIITDNTASTSPSVYRGAGYTVTDSYCVIGDNSGNDFISSMPIQNANGSFVGTLASPVSADLAALADNGGPTRTMAPDPGSLALQLIPRGSEPYYNDSPSEDQRGFWIDRPTDDPDYEERTCGAYWDAASPTPARGFRGWTSTVNR